MPDDPAATSWSTTGAVIAAARPKPAAAHKEAPTQTPFALAMSAVSTAVSAGPQSWNDHPEPSHDEVLAALTTALKLVHTNMLRGADTGNRDHEMELLPSGERRPAPCA